MPGTVSLVTATVEAARAFHQELDALRESHGKTEYKWTKTTQRHGIALADFFFARHGKMRADVLVWDIKDSRHGGLRNRDDKANFARMYYHLLHNTLKRRWPDGARWLVCPGCAKGSGLRHAGAMPRLEELGRRGKPVHAMR